MRILVTGFNAFGKVEVNPSQVIVERIAATPYWLHDIDVIAEVLPTEFEGAGHRIGALIREHQPDAVVCLGVAQKREAINLERIAKNVNDAKIPDNTGKLMSGEKIIPDGVENYTSTLPLETMKAALEQHNIPVTFSDDAGAYVCNHVFYLARHEIEQLGSNIPCGFIHIPGIGEEAPGLPIDVMFSAVEHCLRQVVALKVE